MKIRISEAFFALLLSLSVDAAYSKTVLLKQTDVQDGTDSTVYTFTYNPNGTLDSMYSTCAYGNSVYKYVYATDTLVRELLVTDLSYRVVVEHDFYAYDKMNRITLDSTLEGGMFVNPPINSEVHHYTYGQDTSIDTAMVYDTSGKKISDTFTVVNVFDHLGDTVTSATYSIYGNTVCRYAYSDHNGQKLLDSAITSHAGGSLMYYYANIYDATGTLTMTHSYVAPSAYPAINFISTYEYGDIATPIASNVICGKESHLVVHSLGSELTIDVPGFDGSGISGAIYDVSGRKIMDLPSLGSSKGAACLTIGRNSLGAPGAYFLKMVAGGQKISSRFVIK